MKLSYKWILPILALGFVACESDDDGGMDPITEVEYSAGTADFSTYVSLGNSLTAGYTDGALFQAAQMSSFPNLLAGQFGLVGGGEFTQPLMADNLGGMLIGGNQFLENRLIFDGSGPVRLPGNATTEVTQKLSGPFNNMGVPGAKSYHLVAPGYGSLAALQQGLANPYYVRFSSGEASTVLEDAMAQNPSFFTLWIGANDVLGYAIDGGDGENQAGNFDPSTYGGSDITDPQVFAQVYSSIVTALTSGGAKGVVANVPNVTVIPYFTTVPYNAIPLDGPTAAFVNQGFAQYNGGLQQLVLGGAITAEEAALRTVNFMEGQNAPVIIDEDLTDLSGFGLPPYRQLKEGELLVLPSANFLGTLVNDDPTLVNGVSVPLEDKWALTATELEEIDVATRAFNEVIAAVAAQNDLAVVDAYTIINQAPEGIPFDEFVFTNDLVTGGLFSLDGIHLTPRGNAFVANQCMAAIEAKYGAVLPRYKAGDFGVLYPVQLP
ncbi:SGNH/GDSL hydrolase family protein [Robertkochia sediminum]|uniref:SGNH/GDSL hydrolase family protein n=1 Tax=Robertkochia sediminum TaxID=2785326 RepID=UPI00193275E0|nr:SGNH/GDSL hydrolase family protein [Robertkochia sediminum]MBL7471954.1 SGNH/GDSL hydrolase family protein [Robertkochia sediminum]